MAKTELDYMEYSSDANARTAYPTDATVGSDTKLLLHLDNNVTDSSPSGHTVTNNNVTFATTGGKFSYYGIFNGTNAALTLGDSGDWNFGSGDFTIDFWVRFSTLPSVNGKVAVFFRQYVVTGGLRYFWLYVYTDNTLKFGYNNSGDSSSNSGSVSWTPTVDTWYHIAFVHEGGDTFYLFIDGVDQDLTPSGTGHNLPDVPDVMYIGWAGPLFDDPADHYFDGYIDEFRVSKGIARWTSNFTPPTHAYGSTYEFTPTISSSNTWERKTFDISSISNANKDAISQIKITIVNADADNTFYIDNMYAGREGLVQCFIL